ncbi:MAG TPA: RNA polymerase sigma factor [Saprospiraceae bacterium]|nr:RNA polymerase sigma factor [Saprospiraceae bacterium]HRX29949.1 RNA polymerase sigma factor [Saprospiraceae bacterium]
MSYLKLIFKTLEDQIISQVLAGNINAYRDLILKYQHMVMALSLRLLKNPEDAEELAQDVFLKAFENLSTFKGDAKFSSWLYTINYRLGLNILKKKKIDIAEYSEYEYQLPDSSENIMEKTIKMEKNNALKKAIDNLAPQDAYIIQLYYYEEMSIEEISKIVLMTETNVKTRLFRSRKQLQKHYSNN